VPTDWPWLVVIVDPKGVDFAPARQEIEVVGLADAAEVLGGLVGVLDQRKERLRVASSFFDRLDELLPAERTGTGTPSTADFLLHELPPLMDALAEDHAGMTLAVEGLPQVRVMIASGVLAPRLALYVTLAADGPSRSSTCSWIPDTAPAQ